MCPEHISCDFKSLSQKVIFRTCLIISNWNTFANDINNEINSLLQMDINSENDINYSIEQFTNVINKAIDAGVSKISTPNILVKRDSEYY